MNAKIGKEIDQHPFLRGLSPEHAEIMLKNATHVEYEEGRLILKQGEPANRFYLIESGKVMIETGKRNGQPVQTLGAGEVLGWSWLFAPFCWHFNARAIAPTKCLVLDGGHLLVTAEENHEFGYDLMRLISQMVIERLQAAREKMIEVSKLKQR